MWTFEEGGIIDYEEVGIWISHRSRDKSRV